MKVKPLLVTTASRAELEAMIEEYRFIGYTDAWLDVDRAKNQLIVRTRPRGAK